MAEFGGPVLLSSLVLLEVTNAAGLRSFRNPADNKACEQALKRFATDRESGLWIVPPWPASAWNDTYRLSQTYTPELGARSLDIAHVAAALAARAEFFLTFDERQARLAQAAGLTTPIATELRAASLI
jgi:hypothetical protein